ncbi:RND transporter [Acinetobacter sp. LoGeW2-3]|uniref:HlyD family secretion protein n=1 Tax=Acinetobacter sp. LoGeW2-3 TaxID=1808001 RepID=UPI000C05B872|nr:HlyD family secretion protein [Acinetobacter sp. LoGeW2-3]ATO19124.1 RND transporter [Acinetobacter sp. LoGeW2-3]
MEAVLESQDVDHLSRRKIVAWIIFGALFVALMLCVAYYFMVYRYYQSTDNAYVQADVTWLMPKISGEVIQLKVKDNQFVKQGDVLALIDHRDYQARYDQARSMVDLKTAAIAIHTENEKSAQFSIEEALSNVNAAQAELGRLEADYLRYQQLLGDGVITRQRFETIESQYVSARAQLARSQAMLNTAKAQYGSVQAGRAQIMADLNNAKATVNLYQVDLNAAKLMAPVSGNIGSLSIQLGSRVTPQSRVLAIIPENSVFVEANFKETQIEKMHKGQKVQVKLDAYPNLTYRGIIDSFSPASGATFSMMPSDNATGNFNKVVQRIPIRIVLEPHPQIELVKPGMSVIAKVDLRS